MLIEEIKNIPSTKSDLKKFGVTIGIVLVLIAIILFYLTYSSYLYFAAVGLLFIILAYFFPIILIPIQKFWMVLALILGWISTRIILSVLFYLIMTPIGLAAKIFRKDFLNLKLDKSNQSYWNYREKVLYTKEKSERQF